MILKPQFSQLTSTALLTLALCGAARAQDATDARAGWFPFVVPTLADAQTSGSALDLSFLSPKPAGSDGFLRARGGQIVDGQGRVIQFFGTNITDYAVMPPKDLAQPIARRLRELGVNMVRLHYFDWAAAPDGILGADMQTLNPEKLDQMDWLIYQLKQHGIYVDINLHVARRYPGLPANWDWMGKSIDRIAPQFIDSQKQFARDLLTHTNPYTKTSYNNEPAVAFIELNNENTALQTEYNTAFSFANLPEATKAPIRALWNSWLRGKYGDTAKLRAVWDGDLPATGPQLVSNGDFTQNTQGWGVEASGGAAATAQTVSEDGQTFLRWNATKAGAEYYNLQLHQNNIAVEDGQQISIKVRARADKKRVIQVRLMNGAEPWASVSPTMQMELEPQWKEFELYGPVTNPQGIVVRLSFDALNTPGTYDIDDVSVRVDGKAGVPDGATLENGSVPLVSQSANFRARADYVDFIAARERQTSGELMRFLRDELKVKAMLWDTQANYGGGRGLAREIVVGSDVIDIHDYPSHPNGTRDESGKWTWSTARKSMLGEVFDRLPHLALWRVQDKPFFVSEFDLNPPNDYSSETIPMLSAMTAYQGWSGFAEYAWLNFPGGNYDPNAIRSPFQTAGHAGQIAWMPTSALLLRQKLIAPAQSQRTLNISKESLLGGTYDWSSMTQNWDGVGSQRTDGWRQRLAVNIAPVATPTAVGNAPADSDDKLVVSDTGQIRFDRTTKGAETMTINAPALRMAFGHTGGQSFDLGDAKISVEPGTLENYANMALVALDGLPLSQSRRVLVTAVARVENKGMIYNEARTSVGKEWGEGPTLAEPVKFAVSVPGAGWRASALDGKGRVVGALKMSGATLKVSEPSSLWYLLERP